MNMPEMCNVVWNKGRSRDDVATNGVCVPQSHIASERTSTNQYVLLFSKYAHLIISGTVERGLSELTKSGEVTCAAMTMTMSLTTFVAS